MSPTTTQVDDATVAAAQQLVLAQDATRASLTSQAQVLASQAVSGFDGWYDPQQITRWAADVASRVEALQRVLARSTDAYLARFASQVTGQRVRPSGGVDVSSLRMGGVTHAGAYARAADVFRYQQSLFDRVAGELDRPGVAPPGLTPGEAAVDRAAAVAELDTQLVVRAQAQRSLVAQGRLVVGYRRVLHPEQAKGGSCGLCVAASTQLYHVEKLMPIHAHCGCLPAPVYDKADVADALNRVDLGEVYGAAGGSTAGADLKRTRYQVDEHGELGPVLNPAGTHVRTLEQTRRDTGTSRTAKSSAEQRKTLQRIHDSLAGGLPQVHDLAVAEPDKWAGYEKQLVRRVADLARQLAN